MTSGPTDWSWAPEDTDVLRFEQLLPTVRMAPGQVTLPTPVLSGSTEYEEYKLEVEAWLMLTDLPKEKQGLMLAFTIDKDHPLGLRAKVLGLNVGKEKLSKADGVKNLLDYLDTIYGQDKFVQLYKVYNKFQENKRGKEESVEQYISNFESVVLGIKYPTVVKAFKLLEGSRVTEIEKKLIVSSVKYENNEAGLYKDMVTRSRRTLARPGR